jgi:hypothetical protein
LVCGTGLNFNKEIWAFIGTNTTPKKGWMLVYFEENSPKVYFSFFSAGLLRDFHGYIAMSYLELFYRVDVYSHKGLSP